MNVTRMIKATIHTMTIAEEPKSIYTRHNSKNWLKTTPDKDYTITGKRRLFLEVMFQEYVNKKDSVIEVR